MICIDCLEDKPEEEFALRSSEKYRQGKRRTRCKPCSRVAQKRRYNDHRINAFFKHKATRAKSRASALKVPFDLDEAYLESIWTDTCPVLGISLNRHAERTDMNAAELDRFIPELGYAKGNVTWMSRRANQLKNNGTIPELKRILEWMEQNVKDRRP